MYKIDFNKPLNVHFIGIGGISMSGLAEILINNHFTISGSDIAHSKMTEHLQSIGITVYIGHHAENLTNSLDLIVYTAAISKDNPELLSAKALSIPTMDRAELLGQIMANYTHSIGVAGTHGKTTTTSMMSQILLDANLDPTITVGGILDILDGNIRVGSSNYFITEACEYANSFLKFSPLIAIVLNVEEDHLDFFKDINDIRSSFAGYLNNVPENGYIIMNSDIENYLGLLEGLNCNIITYGTNEAISDWTCKNVSFNEKGCGNYDLYYKAKLVDHIQINSTGIHNVYNSIAAIAAAHTIGIDITSSKSSLENFSGPKRRFEYKGSLKGVTVIDDYAHHPTEIEATIKAAQKLEYNKLWIVFQPHTYSRTKAFLNNFAKALSIADHVIITDIYAAREKDPGDIHSTDLLVQMKDINENCHYFASFDDIEIFLLENLVPNDVLITMGAGNIYIVGEDLLNG
ncbi:MAG: UDP-N-acetylmuramate--L-alanine ligase [Firmicutes bacterium HGW-Firmicutes-1]|jgi:UDP-N-acetylmuramate--alanine ligase|nr:MAG: UDP-N-acetylmuramate--L-alanine ligase [Firmicutes bacterium HGW-Firmicutes-1]